MLLNRRAISPPPGLTKHTFADLLLWCHEYGHSTTSVLLTRQNSNCPAGGSDNQGAVGSASSPAGGSSSGGAGSGNSVPSDNEIGRAHV